MHSLCAVTLKTAAALDYILESSPPKAFKGKPADKADDEASLSDVDNTVIDFNYEREAALAKGKLKERIQRTHAIIQNDRKKRAERKKKKKKKKKTGE